VDPENKHTWTLVITGCGTSHGNPPWGDAAWWSEDPRDLRRRSGAMLFGPAGEVVLIDVGPDLMHQLRDPYRRWDGRSYPADGITRCDAVLLTHDHADHCHGINDLRHVNRLMRRGGDRQYGIPVYGESHHLAAVTAMFPYCFGRGDDVYSLGSPALSTHALIDDTPSTIAGLEVVPFAMSHGPAGRTTGFRIGGMAYLTDLKELPADADAHLHDLDLLVLDMLREQPHPTHLCWSEALAIIDRLRPRHTVLTHLGHEVRYHDLHPRLPPHCDLAVDGWTAPFRPTIAR
jgi:phosphoribosyl 1,2-cyclic phosphate phosphodiesterase